MFLEDLEALFKKGIHTSEFWLGLATAVLSSVLAILAATDVTTANWKTVVMAALPVIGAAAYGFVRTWLKTHRIGAIEAGAQSGTIISLPPVAESSADEDGVDEAVPPGQ